MTEDQQPVWVESDGVSNLPTVAGIYRVRATANASYKWRAYFDGIKFYAAVSGDDVDALNYANLKQTCDEDWEATYTGNPDCRYGCDAWWDYQGLMVRPQVNQPNGPIYSDEEEDLIREMTSQVMTSDKPGIAAMVGRNKPASEPEKVVVGGLTIDMADLVEFLKTKQPKPEPNTTPQGILTMWNEGADHRLGMWRTME